MKKLVLFILMITCIMASSCKRDLSYEKFRLSTVTAFAEASDGVENGLEGFYDFSANLFTLSKKEGNTLVAPLSGYTALGMLMNGADGRTLSQTEVALGGNVTTVNQFCLGAKKVIDDVRQSKIYSANSVWIKQEYKENVREEYLSSLSKYYLPEVFCLPFDDELKKHVNAWGYNNTDGEIDELIGDVTPLNRAILANTTFVQGKWIDSTNGTSKDVFYSPNGEQSAEFFSGRSALYETDSAYAIKRYMHGNVYFQAIMPKGEYDKYLSSFSGEELMKIMQTINERGAKYTLPCFSAEFSCDLIPILSGMGMTDAFGGMANFSKMTSANDLCVSQANMQAKIQLDENGLKASGATVIEMSKTSLEPEGKPLVIEFNKPFIYLVAVDNVPLFLGAMEQI